MLQRLTEVSKPKLWYTKSNETAQNQWNNHYHNPRLTFTIKDMNSEQPWTAQSKPLRPLTRKQAAFVKYLVENPKDSASKATRATYGRPGHVFTQTTADTIASENMRKPAILMELAKYSGNAEMAVIAALKASRKVYKQSKKGWELVGEEDDHAIRLRAADSLLDRIHGKATQRIEQRSEAVVINVDLSSATTD